MKRTLTEVVSALSQEVDTALRYLDGAIKTADKFVDADTWNSMLGARDAMRRARSMMLDPGDDD